MSRATSTAVLVAALVLAASAAPAQGAAHRTGVVGDCRDATYEPRTIVIACADGALFLDDLTYTSWDAQRAHARGRLRDTGTAATPAHENHPCTLVLRRPQRHDGVRIFTRAVVRYTVGGRLHTERYDLPTPMPS